MTDRDTLVEAVLLAVAERGVEYVLEKILGEVTHDEARRIAQVVIRRVGLELVRSELDREAQIRLIDVGLDEAEREKFGPEAKTGK